MHFLGLTTDWPGVIGDPYQMAHALTNIGCVLRIQGHYAAANSCFKEALRIYQQVGSGIWCTDPLCALAENEIAQGHLSAVRLHLRDASASAEASENRWLQTLVGYFQGLFAYYEGDMEHAVRLLETTIALARESQYKPDLARSLIALGRVMRARGDVERAAARLQEGLGLYHRLGHILGLAFGLESLAGLAVDKGATYSVKLFGVAKVLRETIRAPLPPVDCPLYESDVARARAPLGEAAFTSDWAEGEAMSLEQVIELALTI